MTTPSPADGSRSVRDILDPLREPLALALLAAGALVLLGALINLLPSGGRLTGVSYPLHVAGVQFVTLVTVGAPVLAVLLTTHLGERTPMARVVTMAAGAEIATALFFGLIFTTVIGFFGAAANLSFITGVQLLFTNVAHLALGAAGLFVVARIWQGLFRGAGPVPVASPDDHQAQFAPGYGQPYGSPAAAGYGQPPAPPSYGEPVPPSYGTSGQGYGQPPGQVYGRSAGASAPRAGQVYGQASGPPGPRSSQVYGRGPVPPSYDDPVADPYEQQQTRRAPTGTYGYPDAPYDEGR